VSRRIARLRHSSVRGSGRSDVNVDGDCTTEVRVAMRGGFMNATATAPAAQHMRALAQANRVRLARAELKKQVAEGEASVADVVLECPWEAESMTISDLLMSQHRWGRTRCRRFLTAIPMSETKTIGTMTERQRRELARLLAGDREYAVAELSWTS
jgi:hypothetical protein